MWASAVVRRFGQQGRSMAAFPFTVNVTAAGDTGIAFVDQFKPKQAKRNIAEMWLPLWNRPASFLEMRSLISEGRATATGRVAESGVDFARAAATLSVDRGINSFQRNMFLMRNGQSFLSISLGRFDVRERSEVDLLREVDHWLNSFRRAAGDKNAPPRFKTALQSIDQAIFDLCRYGGRTRLQSVLIAIGHAERELSITRKEKSARARQSSSRLSDCPQNGFHRPMTPRTRSPSPSPWPGCGTPSSRSAPSAPTLEPVVVSRGKSDALYANWAEKDRAVVWNAADLSTNLVNVLERRMMDGARAGCERPPLASRFAVSLDMVATFLAGEIDDHRIDDLVWGLMLIDNRGNRSQHRQGADDVLLPRAYALLKLLFLPRPLVIEQGADGTLLARLLRDNEEGGIFIRSEPAILPLLRGGRIRRGVRDSHPPPPRFGPRPNA